MSGAVVRSYWRRRVVPGGQRPLMTTLSPPPASPRFLPSPSWRRRCLYCSNVHSRISPRFLPSLSWRRLFARRISPRFLPSLNWRRKALYALSNPDEFPRFLPSLSRLVCMLCRIQEISQISPVSELATEARLYALSSRRGIFPSLYPPLSWRRRFVERSTAVHKQVYSINR